MSLFSSSYQTYYQAHKTSIDSTCLFIYLFIFFLFFINPYCLGVFFMKFFIFYFFAWFVRILKIFKIKD